MKKNINRRTLRNRYSLYIFDRNKTYVVLIEENGKLKDKLDITTIDKFIMSHCNSEENGRLELIDYLNKTIDNKEGVIKEIIYKQKATPTKHISNNANPLILYKSRDERSKESSLTPVYHDPILYAFADTYDSVRKEYNMKLKEFSKKQQQMENDLNAGTLSLDKYNQRINSMGEVLDNINSSIREKPSWKPMVDKVLRNLENGTYVRFIKDNGNTHSGFSHNKDQLISKRFKEFVDSYIYGNNQEKEEARENMSKELERYKVVRGIQLCNKNYQRNINPQMFKDKELEDLIDFGELWARGLVSINDLEPIDESHIFDLPENKYVTNTLTGKKVYFDHTDEYMEEQMNKLEEEKEKVKRK